MCVWGEASFKVDPSRTMVRTRVLLFFSSFFSPLHQHKSYLKERDIRDDEWILHSINQLGERSAERETEKEREIPSFVCCPVAHIWFILPGVNTAWKNKKRRGMQGGWKKKKILEWNWHRDVCNTRKLGLWKNCNIHTYFNAGSLSVIACLGVLCLKRCDQLTFLSSLNRVTVWFIDRKRF